MQSVKVNIFFLFFFWSTVIFGQYIVEGLIIDNNTKEGVPFANIYIKGTTIGTSTDDTGYYKIILEDYYDSLTVSFLGYEEQSKKLINVNKQRIDFLLEEESNELFETIIYANKEPLEDYLFRKIQEFKPVNDKSKFNNYQYNSYSKIEIDIKNINDKLKGRKLLKPFAFVFNNVDSTSEEEPFLPIMLSETISEVYYSKQQNKFKEKVIATKISGTEDESYGAFLGATATEYNIYDNGFNILEKEFISPIAASGKLFYNYRVIDTMIIDNTIHYRMEFQPKGKGSNTFFGNFVVSENNYAIKNIQMNMAKHVNINFISRIIINQDFEFADTTAWILAKDNFTIEFEPIPNKPSIVIRKKAAYKDFLINKPQIETNVKELKALVVVEDDASSKSKAYWDSVRFVPLSKNEKAIYDIVDTIKTIKAYKTYLYIIELLISGNIKAGPLEFGPVSSAISYNQLEGWRFGLGVETNEDFSERIFLRAQTAYGLKDKTWKYGGFAKALLSKKPRQVLALEYIYDVSKLRRTTEAISTSSLLNIAVLRNRNQKLLYATEAKLKYEFEWRDGYSTSLTFQNRKIEPGLIPFQYIEDITAPIEHLQYNLTQTELVLHSRFAIKEKFINNNSIFRSSINSTNIPTFQFEYVVGLKNVLKSEYNYHKLTFYFSDLVQIKPIGKLEMSVQAGKVFGNVPFFLSEVHDGNQTYIFNNRAFNLMNDYEFVSDQYLQWTLIHHFDGFFLNKIPGIRKLKIREYIDFRGVLGTLNKTNKIANQYNEIKEIGKKPYLELGFGLENIVKFIKVGFSWRLTHRVPTAPKWGFLFGLDFDF